MRRIRAQFWIKYRGYVDAFVNIHAPTPPDELARFLIAEALREFERKWPGPRQDELHILGLEDRDAGRVVNSRDVPR